MAMMTAASYRMADEAVCSFIGYTDNRRSLVLIDLMHYLAYSSRHVTSLVQLASPINRLQQNLYLIDLL